MTPFDLQLGNADAIAARCVSEAFMEVADINAPLARLSRDPNAYRLGPSALLDLRRMRNMLAENIADIDKVLAAQTRPVLQAAE